MSAPSAGDAPAESSSPTPSDRVPESTDPSCDDSGDESDGSSSASSAERGGRVIILFERSEGEEWSDYEEEEDFLCTFICDFLACLPRLPNQCWDQGICRRISAGLKKCHLHDEDGLINFNNSSNGIEDVLENSDAVFTVDLRGRYADQAKTDFMMHLVSCSRIPNVMYLKVIVGCKVHGVGKGTLKQAITDLLEHDDTIVWKTENGGSVISIKIDDEKDYSSLEWDMSGKSQPFDLDLWVSRVVEQSQIMTKTEETEATEEEEEDFLCTFICDFMFGIPNWRGQLLRRMVKGVARCNQAERDRVSKFNDSYRIVRDTMMVGIQGQSAVHAIRIVKRYLYHSSCMFRPLSAIRFLKLEVGCKIHGVGEGKLKQAVIDLLEMEDDLKWWEEEAGSLICIRLDDRRHFNFLADDFDPLHPSFGD